MGSNLIAGTKFKVGGGVLGMRFQFLRSIQVAGGIPQALSVKRVLLLGSGRLLAARFYDSRVRGHDVKSKDRWQRKSLSVISRT